MIDIEDYKVLLSNLQGDSIPDPEGFRREWLSKSGKITLLYAALKAASPEEKRTLGKEINDLRNRAEELLAAAQENAPTQKSTVPAQDHSLEPAPIFTGALHPLTLTLRKMTDIFTNIGFEIAEGKEITDDWHNFTALNMPEDHPARDMQDTFFIEKNPDIVLRTHTSSVQVEIMQKFAPPIRVISPGRVFRKDNDSTHSPVFHQVEGLYVDRNVSFADLKQVLFHFVEEMFGEKMEMRFRPSFFPFTEPSAEMDIRVKGTDKWMEIFGCGMVDPAVLDNCGIDSSVYTGYAFGIGVERVAMLKFGIQDIRLFYENDLRFLSQFKHISL